jgi:hypothetical protein
VVRWLRLREGDRCAGSDCLALLWGRRTMACREGEERRERRRDMMSPPLLARPALLAEGSGVGEEIGI